MSLWNRAGRIGAAVGVAAFQLGCTNTNIPDLNNSSVAGFSANPTTSGVQALFDAMLRGERDATANVVLVIGAFGREGYSLSVAHADLPFYMGAGGPLVAGTFLTDMLWPTQYQDIREANLVLDNTSKITSLTTAQIAALNGLVQTMEATDWYQLAVTRDSLGLPIAVDASPTSPPAPIAPRAAVFQHILNLLDSGATNLAAGGSAFPLALPSGFAGFNTPATFLTVNRALRVRVDIFLGNYPQALTDLSTSFLSTSAPLSTGVYFNYSSTSGDEGNALFLPYLYASPRLVDSAQLQADGSPDLREQTKIVTVPSFTFDGLTSQYHFTMYNSTTAPLPLIRNEELILLQAEAYLGIGDEADALTDINFIRTNSGGLPATTLADYPTPAALLNELLYEKRYSLMYEGGHVWIDMKHYQMFANLPAAIPGGHIFNVMPFYLADCNEYGSPPPGCANVIGVPGVAGESP